MRSASKFTAERRQRILAGIEEGLPITHAAAVGGVSKQTLYTWLERGQKEPGGQYGEFAEQVETAQAQAAKKALGHWNKAMPDDWRAAMEFLARRFPDDWAKRERHEVSGPDGEPIRVELHWPTGLEPPR